MFNIVSINFDYTQNFSHILKEVGPSDADSFDLNTVIERVHFKSYPFLNEPVVIKNMAYISDSINTILREYTYKKQFFYEAVSAVFKNILVDIVRHAMWDKKEIESINRVLEYIHVHYCEEITNESLSAMAGYHPYHLNRLMKSATGTTLHQYLINYRIEAAKKYLWETEKGLWKYPSFADIKTSAIFLRTLTASAEYLQADTEGKL